MDNRLVAHILILSDKVFGEVVVPLPVVMANWVIVLIWLLDLATDIGLHLA